MKARNAWPLLALAVGSLLGPVPLFNAAAQQQLTLQLQILQPTSLTFDLNTPAAGQTYPPAAFPASYTPTSPATSSAQEVQLQLQVSGRRRRNPRWRILASAPNFAADFPVNRLEYALNSTPNTWVAMTTSTHVFASGQGRGTFNFFHRYRLNLQGDEPPGSFSTTVTYSAVSP